MKRIFIYLFAAAAALGTASCDKNDKDNEPKEPQNPVYDQTIQRPDKPIPEI